MKVKLDSFNFLFFITLKSVFQPHYFECAFFGTWNKGALIESGFMHLSCYFACRSAGKDWRAPTGNSREFDLGCCVTNWKF